LSDGQGVIKLRREQRLAKSDEALARLVTVVGEGIELNRIREGIKD